jgi:hypothetical protein
VNNQVILINKSEIKTGRLRMKVEIITLELAKCLEEQGFLSEEFLRIRQGLDFFDISKANIVMQVMDLLNKNFEIK